MKKYKVPPKDGYYWTKYIRHNDNFETIVRYELKDDDINLDIVASDEVFKLKDFEYFIGPIPEPNADELEFED